MRIFRRSPARRFVRSVRLFARRLYPCVIGYALIGIALGVIVAMLWVGVDAVWQSGYYNGFGAGQDSAFDIAGWK